MTGGKGAFGNFMMIKGRDGVVDSRHELITLEEGGFGPMIT